ncbi:MULTISPECIES: kelch repeat-containing protein [unclassified Crossiella]|uniref:kelch repeat-containing protein n=1 Tax=unclassified Crossiella TaxID=2620835 RepID=UPI001FFE9F88|nr:MULTISPECIES: kelch repeat-containing protein [unclassified Crossiella]MCK2239051.1 hypothetical protein [Crossiella sp. S99.2]MCK2251380.1 hypothetical protein [Crossiella sp. S99.1]
MSAGTLELLARELGEALRPLADRLAPETREQFLLSELGVWAPGGLGAAAGAIGTVVVQAGGLAPIVQRLAGAINSGDAPAILAEGVTLIGAIKSTLSAVDALGPALESVVSAAAGLTPAQKERLVREVRALPKRLIDYAAVTHLERTNQTLADLLSVLGIVDRVAVPANPADPTVVPVRYRVLHFDRLLKLITDPATMLREALGFGRPDFDGSELFIRLANYLAAQHRGFQHLKFPGGARGFQAEGSTLTVDPGSTPPSLRLDTQAQTTADFTHTVQLGPLWTLKFTSRSRLTGRVQGRITPPLAISIEPGAGGALDAEVSLEAKRPNDEPIVLLGQTGASRLEIARFALALGLQVQAGSGAEPTVQLRLEGGRVVIDLSKADGFIKTITRGAKIESGFELRALWSPSTGLRLEGSGSLDLALPINVGLGPIEITTLFIGVGITDDAAPVELSGSFKAELGPIKATVERLGVIADVRFPGGGGNLGPVDVGFRFKAPNGIGLSVNAGLIAGGGFLYADPDRGEYAGALSLEFAGFIELNAIGLISTRFPDGDSGFSLLIVIATEFGGGGIQLGYGFTLLAVGGLIGLNRGMDLQALTEGVRTGSIESVMFPQDVVANAPRIISDLRRFFPPEKGHFLIGPMAKIGWGTPTLVSVSLGVIVEIPPGTIAILGVLKCILPHKALPLIQVQVAFVGAFEPDKSRLWFYAQLFDSRILTMTIDGGMGLLVAWGDHPEFVLTVGGFHPSFTPPPLPFPVPPRLSVDILNQPTALIRVSGYFAITSNSAQFGAKAELRLGFSDFGLHGHLAFDALFRFSPFSFVISISAGVSLKAFGVGLFGIDLRFQLEGPAPWRAAGRGSISLLFFEISADFDISWGEKRDTTLPPVSVLELLGTELSKTEGWETRLPSGGTRALVTLRTLDPANPLDNLVLHPLGSLFIRQRALPLDVRIDKVGQQAPSDGNRFTFEPKQNSGLRRVASTGEKFAMAQFQQLEDAEKLSRPAYETQNAGLELAAGEANLLSSLVVRRSARYEEIITDKKRGIPGVARMSAAEALATPVRKRLVSISPAVFEHLIAGSSTARSPLSAQQANQLQPFAATDTVRIQDQRYVITKKRDNAQAFPPLGAPLREPEFRSLTTARDALAEWINADPRLADTLHVIPLAELAGPLAASGTWSDSPAAPLAVAGAGAVRLGNGKVLLVGGTGADGVPVAEAAVFDPAADAWLPAKPLSTARVQHTTTLLATGRVLVAGGLDSTGKALKSAELYDPISGSWTTLPAMQGARAGHTATALPDGSALITGGRDTRTLSTVELLGADGKWAQAKPMLDTRTGHHALVRDQTVLVIGGAFDTGGPDSARTSCESYDLTTGTWSAAPALALPRSGHQATALGERVLVTGGDPIAPRLHVPAHLDPPYRPDGLTGVEALSDNAWSPQAELPGGRTGHRAVALRTGRLLVIGGTSLAARGTGFRNVTAYDPNSNTWVAAGALRTGRWDAAVVELGDGRVLIIGGRTHGGAITAGTETYIP